MKTKVLIVDRIYERSEDMFSSAVDIEFIVVGSGEQEISAKIAETKAKAVVLATEKYTGSLYDTLAEGGLIARYGVGHDGIDKSLATAKRQPVVITPAVLDNSVAEHSVFLAGASLRNIASSDAAIKAGGWTKSTGSELYGKTLAIIGCGAIGKKVAKIASFGFGMNVVAFDVAKLDTTELKDKFGITALTSDYAEAIKDADIVSIHLPALEATKDFVNAEFLSQMKPTATLVNTSRGSIVDEAALYDALKNKTIASAAIDVYKKEPYAAVAEDKDLRSLDNIVMTSHLGSSTKEASERMADCVLKNIRLWLAGDLAKMDIVNREII